MIEAFVSALPQLLKGGASLTQWVAQARKNNAAANLISEGKLYTSSFDPQRLRIMTELERAELSHRHVEDVMAFLSSDSGLEALRILTIAAATKTRASRQQLNSMVTVLLSLHLRKEEAWHGTAGKSVANHCLTVIQELENKAQRNRDAREFWADLKADAETQLMGDALFRQKSTEERIVRLKALVHVLPTDITSEVERYIAKVVDDNEDLVVPNVGNVVRAPFDSVYVPPRFLDLERDEALGLDSNAGAEAASVGLYTGDYFDDDEDEEEQGQLLQPNLLLEEWIARRKLVILGDPGAGKSTLGQSAMLHLARALADNPHGRVPFRVVLRHFDQAWLEDPDLGFIKHLGAGSGEPEVAALETTILRYLLHVGRAAVVFDGLDEVLDFERRANIAKRIGQFAKAFPSSLVMVSARTVGYSDTPVPQFNDYFAILPFDDAQVETFADHFSSTAALSGVDFSVQRFLRETESIADLRSNPLLLGILCILYGQGRSIPRNRSDLYSKCAEMLFDAWDSRKGTTVISEYRDLAEQATQEMALAIFEESQEEVSEGWIHSFLERFHGKTVQAGPAAARRFALSCLELWRGRRWLLVYVGTGPDGDHYRFSHRTFLEYFAARQLTYEAEDGLRLWERLRPHVLTRTAEPFCLLAIDMGSKLRRQTPEEFFAAIGEEATNAGAPREVASVCIFAAKALISCRVSPERKAEACSCLIRSMAKACIPRVGVHELRVQEDSLEPTLFYKLWVEQTAADDWSWVGDAEESTLSDADLRLWMAAGGREAGDEYTAVPVFSAWGDFVYFIARISEWSEGDMTPLETAFQGALAELVANDLESGLLLLYALMFGPFGDGFRHFGEEAESASLELLRERASVSWRETIAKLDSRDLEPVSDLWLRVQLVRDGLPCWGRLACSPSGWAYLVGGRAFPGAPDDGHATTAHYTVLSCLNMSDARVAPYFSTAELGKHVEWLTAGGGAESLLGVRHNCLGYFWTHGEDIVAHRGEVSNLRKAVALLWLTVLYKVEDRYFFMNVLRALRARPDCTDLVSALETVLYPGDWDGGPVATWEDIPSKLGPAVDRVLERARKTPPWSLTE